MAPRDSDFATISPLPHSPITKRWHSSFALITIYSPMSSSTLHLIGLPFVALVTHCLYFLSQPDTTVTLSYKTQVTPHRDWEGPDPSNLGVCDP